MPRAIWKVILQDTEQQETRLPAGSNLLAVGYQNGRLVLWAEVDTDLPATEELHITTHGTGHPLLRNRGQYVGTVQIPSGLVWHVYAWGPTHVIRTRMD